MKASRESDCPKKKKGGPAIDSEKSKHLIAQSQTTRRKKIGGITRSAGQKNFHSKERKGSL